MARKKYIHLTWDEDKQHWHWFMCPLAFRNSSNRYNHYTKKLSDALVQIYLMKDKNFLYTNYGVKIIKGDDDYKVKNRYDQNERLTMVLCYGP